MEIVLDSLTEWIEKRFKKRPILKCFLVFLVFSFGCWLAYVEWVAWYSQ